MLRLKGFRLAREIVAYAVRACHCFALNTADVGDLLAERGVIVSREAIRIWVNWSGTHFAACIRRVRPRPNDKWHMDEVVVSINGGRHWLWRAVGGNGDALDILVQMRRNAKVAKCFLTRSIAQFGPPRVIITDKLRSYTKPIARLAPGADHRAHKGLNRRIENSHRPTRRREKIVDGSNPRNRRSLSLPLMTRSTAPANHACRLTASSYRHAREDAFELWADHARVMKP